MCIAARQDRLQRWPSLGAALSELSGKFTNADMQSLNYQVDGLHRPVAQVARSFCKLPGCGISRYFATVFSTA